MKISTQRSDRNLCMFLDGELDHHAARGLMDDMDRELDVALPISTVLDMSKVGFMDSSGIAVILRLNRRMKNLGGTLTVVNIPPQALKVLDTAGIKKYVTIR